MRHVGFWKLALVLLAALSPAFAADAILRVKVTSQNDNTVLPGAKVTLASTGGGVVQSRLTGPDGEAALSAAPGSYLVTVEFPAFRKEEFRDIHLTDGVTESLSAKLQEYLPVSIVNLLAAPERYNGRAVAVSGFVSLKFENEALYFHREDWQRGLTRNAVWLVMNPNLRSTTKRSDRRYAKVQGVFSSAQAGHGGLFGGAVTVDALETTTAEDGN
jgi:hypothetical protein